LEELTRGFHVPDSSSSCTSSSKTLMPIPPTFSASSSGSLLGAPHLGPSRGGGPWWSPRLPRGAWRRYQWY
jgi:hypothetical protein